MDATLFPLGQTVATPGAIEALKAANRGTADLLQRHRRGDWGDIHPDDRGENEWALNNEARLVSVYRLSDDLKIWIITEADRSVTTILLPDEY